MIKYKHDSLKYKVSDKSLISINQTQNAVTADAPEQDNFDSSNTTPMKTFHRIILLTVGILTAVLCASVVF